MADAGHLKIFLGFAAGVGKTYRMLEEAQQLARARHDLVIGYFEPHGRPDTIGLTAGLETVPRRRIEYRTAVFEEMDTAAILARRPEICLVDEFAHTNVPGSERAKRWEDVMVLLEAGIDVHTTLNVQHLESLNDQVWRISGVRVRETVPDWAVQRANEVVMVDLTPRALLNRLERGVVYEPEKARRAMDSFFREPTLGALRELALRQTAHEIESRQTPADLPAPSGAAPAPAAPDQGGERMLVCVTANPSAAMLLRRVRRVADYLHADCFAAHVHASSGVPSPHAGWGGAHADDDAEALEQMLNFARNLHFETRALRGSDIAGTLADFARLQRVTQIFLIRPRTRAFAQSVAGRLMRLAPDMQVTIVAGRR